MQNNISLPPQPLTLNSLTNPEGLTAEASQSEGVFSQMLSDAIGQAAGQQVQADRLVEDHLLGHSVTDIEVLTAIKKADLTLKAMLQVRNKVVDAYKELKQVQV